MPAEKDPLAVCRGEFPILETSTDLTSSALGATPRAAIP